MILTAVSCSVYDASLLGTGPAEGGNGGGSSAGRSGSAGEGTSEAGRSGFAGASANGGTSGANGGDAGMMDNAGAMENGGETSEGGGAGSGATSGKGGTAGTSGKGGGSGTAGNGGTGGGSSTAGSGGAAATAGTAGSVAGAGGAPPATGCAKLSAVLDDMNDRAHFVISLGSATDLSSATSAIISMRLYVQAGAAGTIFNYVQDSQYHFLGASRAPLKSLTGWQTLTFNVGTQDVGTSNIAKADIRRIGIEINGGPDTTGWSNPTVVYVDSISVMTPALSFPLDTMSTVISTPTGTDPSSRAMWLHNGTSDTTATSVALTWQGSCP